MFDTSPAGAAIVDVWERDLQLMRDMKGDLLVDMAIETVIAIWVQGRLKTIRSPQKLITQIIQRQDWMMATNDPPADSVEHVDGALVRGRKL
jgi:hypothetical protein